MVKPKSTLSRFEAKIARCPMSGCWIWTAVVNENEYGRFYVGNGMMMSAHRVSWLLYVGEIPQGICVLHRCDNSFCVNPYHLFLGTQQDNMADMFGKGRNRHIRGEDHYCAKLTSADVVAIRDDQRPQRTIASVYGIGHAQVGAIKRRQNWRHIP